jgi:hypothetical protein
LTGTCLSELLNEVATKKKKYLSLISLRSEYELCRFPPVIVAYKFIIRWEGTHYLNRILLLMYELALPKCTVDGTKMHQKSGLHEFCPELLLVIV